MRKKFRRKSKPVESFFCDPVFELSTAEELEFFYRQCFKLRVPSYIKEKPKPQTMKQQDPDFYEEIKRVVDDFPVMSPDQFKKNVFELLYILRQRKIRNNI